MTKLKNEKCKKESVFMEERKCVKEILILLGLLILTIVAFPRVTYQLYELFNMTNVYNSSNLKLSLLMLTWEHIVMSFFGCMFSTILGLAVGIICTIDFGKEIRVLIEKLMSLSQALPTIGFLAVLVPIFGFGVVPGIIVLVISGIMPIVFSTITGLENVPASFLEAGRGLGMSGWEVFWRVKVPSAIPVIIAGIRTTSVIIVGCATLAAITGAGGLGIPIFSAGIRGFNPVKLLEGTIPVTLLALLVDRTFVYAEMKAVRKFGCGSY